MNRPIFLQELAKGCSAHVEGLSAAGAMRRRLLDIGLVKGAPVTCIGAAPSGDPRAYLICGAVIAIRNRDAQDVRVTC